MLTKVEQCWKLNIREFSANDGLSHLAKAECDGQEMSVAYSLSYTNDLKLANITFQSYDEVKSQIIEIESVELPLGDKEYFKCQCGRRCSVLYLIPGGDRFACRNCHKLVYQVKGVSKSLMGGVLYKMNRLACLMEKREKIRRALYDGRPTKRVESFIKLREKWGV